MVHDQTQTSIAAGTRVMVISTKRVGEVVKGPNRKGEYQISFGNLLVLAAANELQLLSDRKELRKQKRASAMPVIAPAGRDRSVDLHGLTVAEALEKVEKELDRALLGRIYRLQVVHGIGTGAVKNALHSYLKKNSHVSRFEVDSANRGTTWVYL